MIPLLVSGLAIGAIYALAALGFVMIYNATRAVNFAHGELVMLGGYMAITASAALGVPPAAALLLVPLGMAAIGVLLQLVAYEPLRNKPFETVFVSTLAIGIILSNLVQVIWGPSPRAFQPVVPGYIGLGATQLSWQQVLIVLIGLVLVAFQRWLFAHTALGRQLRATAQDSEAALLMGVRVRRMIVFTFALAAAFAGVAGVLVAPILFLLPSMGPTLILKIYIAVVIGGFGSLGGAVLGGLALGVLEVLTAGYITSEFQQAVTFGVLLLVLLFRPQGLFGEIAERA